MKYKSVITSHTNPTLSGVAKFNDVLSRMLGIPCLGIDETYQQKQGPVLISVKLGEGIFSDLHAIENVNKYLLSKDIVYDIFFHSFDGLDIEYKLVKNARRVFCGNEEMKQKLLGKHNYVISAWCPALLSKETALFESQMNMFSFGMAHKIQVTYYKMLRDLLQKNNFDYALHLSTAFHEKANFGDFNAISSELTKIFSNRIQFLGFLSDETVNYFLKRSHLFIAFFDKGVRANNTSVFAAMERGCAVLTNLDQYSPGWLKHGENMLDIHYIQNNDLSMNRLGQIGNTAKEFVTKNVNWHELVYFLTMNEPTSQPAPNILTPTLGDNASIKSEKNIPNNTDRKIKSKQDIINIISDLRKNGKKIVFTSGCFDILHIGHTRCLKKARSFGDVLIVAMNTDNSTRQLKGQGRPIMNQNDRAELISELTYVDYIVLFNEDTASNLISEIKPDTYVKGGDYRDKDYENWPEPKIILDYGGKVEIVDLVSGKSSTNMIKKI